MINIRRWHSLTRSRLYNGGLSRRSTCEFRVAEHRHHADALPRPPALPRRDSSAMAAGALCRENGPHLLLAHAPPTTQVAGPPATLPSPRNSTLPPRPYPPPCAPVEKCAARVQSPAARARGRLASLRGKKNT